MNKVNKVINQKITLDGQDKGKKVQKLRPIQKLWDNELAQLKTKQAIMEYFPTIQTYLRNILQEKQQQQKQDDQEQQEQQFFITYDDTSYIVLNELSTVQSDDRLYLNILYLSRSLISEITQLAFDAQCSYEQILQVLKEEVSTQQISDVDLNISDGKIYNFTDLLSIQQVPENSIQQQEDMEEEKNDKNVIVEIIKILLQHYKSKFYEKIFQYCGVQPQALTNDTTEQQQNKKDVIRFDTIKPLQLDDLDKYGLPKDKVFNFRHIFPNTTLVKIYQSASVETYFKDVVDKYEKNKDNQEFGYILEPQLINSFVKNQQSYLLLCNIKKDENIYAISQDILNRNEMRLQQSRDTKKEIYHFKQAKIQTEIEQESEQNVETLKIQQIIYHLAIQLPQQFSKSNIEKLVKEIKYPNTMIIQQDQIDQFIKLWKYKKIQVNNQPSYSQLTNSQYQVPSSNQQYTNIQKRQSQYSPIQNFNVYKKEEILKNYQAIQMIGLQQMPKINYITQYLRQCQVNNLLAWNLNCQFTQCSGPVRIYNNQIFFIINDKTKSEQVISQINHTLFNNQSITAQIADPSITQHLLRSMTTLSNEQMQQEHWFIVLNRLKTPGDPKTVINTILRENQIKQNVKKYQPYEVQNLVTNLLLSFETREQRDQAALNLLNGQFQSHPVDVVINDF